MQVEELIGKFAKKGSTPSQIGVMLRDSHGVPQVNGITGSKVLRILKKQGKQNTKPAGSAQETFRAKAWHNGTRVAYSAINMLCIAIQEVCTGLTDSCMVCAACTILTQQHV